MTSLASILSRWDFTDGSSKAHETYSGQDWYSIQEGFDGLMGAKNMRGGLSPLHLKIKALIWSMECMQNIRQFHIIFATDCSRLVNMVSTSEEWLAFATYMKDIKLRRGSFNHSEIIHISRTQNLKADGLAHSVGINRLLSFIWMQSYQFGCRVLDQSV